MSSSVAHPRITLLPPPGASVYIARKNPSSSEVPPLFYDAQAVRYEVFIREQDCDPDDDIDAADPVSWHWVLFAPSSKNVNGTTEGKDDTPAATIRLVPASVHDHGHDVKHGAEAVTDEGGQGAKMATEPNYGKSNSGMWDGQEPYAMIGRIATLRAHRGNGFGKVLVEHALDWARRHPRETGGETGENWKGLLLAHAQVKVEGWYKGMDGFEMMGWGIGGRRGLSTWECGRESIFKANRPDNCVLGRGSKPMTV